MEGECIKTSCWSIDMVLAEASTRVSSIPHPDMYIYIMRDLFKVASQAGLRQPRILICIHPVWYRRPDSTLVCVLYRRRSICDGTTTRTVRTPVPPRAKMTITSGADDGDSNQRLPQAQTKARYHKTIDIHARSNRNSTRSHGTRRRAQSIVPWRLCRQHPP